jgi:hypothetical protein
MNGWLGMRGGNHNGSGGSAAEQKRGKHGEKGFSHLGGTLHLRMRGNLGRNDLNSG